MNWKRDFLMVILGASLALVLLKLDSPVLANADSRSNGQNMLVPATFRAAYCAEFPVSQSDWQAASAVANAVGVSTQPIAGAQSPSVTNRPETPPKSQISLSPENRQWALSHATNPHALVGAVLAGDRELVQELLSKGADVNAEACNHIECNKPLTAAVIRGDADMVRTLLAAHADVDTRADPKHASRTVLCNAAALGNANVARVLIANGATVNAPDANGTTPLMWAAMNGNIEVVRVLLASGADPAALDSRGRTAAEVARLSHHDSAAQVFASQGALTSSSTGQSGGISSQSGATGRTYLSQESSPTGFAPSQSAGEHPKESPAPSALLAAISAGDATLVRKLIDQGADVNREECHDSDCYRPLYVAAVLKGDPIITQILISAGANIEAKDSKRGATVLVPASLQGYTEVVRVLLDNKANANAGAEKNNGDTALMVASQAGHVDIVKLLIANLADVNAKNEKGHTALWFAEISKHNEVIQVLKSAGGKR